MNLEFRASFEKGLGFFLKIIHTKFDNAYFWIFDLYSPLISVLIILEKYDMSIKLSLTIIISKQGNQNTLLTYIGPFLWSLSVDLG